MFGYTISWINRITANGVYIRHYRQLTDDVAVRRNIANRCVEGSNSDTVIAVESVNFHRAFDPQGAIAIRFDLRSYSESFLQLFLPGLIAVILLNDLHISYLRSSIYKH